MKKLAEDPDREIWKNLADATKPDEETPEEELPKAEDFVEGPLPETAEEAAERQRKLEAAQRAEAAKAAEEAQRIAQIQREDEELKRREEEARRRIEEEARKHREEEDRRVQEEEERKFREEQERVRRAEAAKAAEEAQRLAQILREEEAQKKLEEAERRLQEEKNRKFREEQERIKRAEEERKFKEEVARKSVEELAKETAPSYVPETENLLLQGIVNLLQPALDIKLESKRYQRWIKGWDRAIEMHIVGEGYTHILIKDNQMKAGLGKAPKEPDIVMEGDYETITNYLNGELDPILMFFDFVLLRKVRFVKGLEIKLTSLLDGSLLRQARDLYRMDKILRIR